MAKPIKETPVLRGEDAKRFLILRESSKNQKVNPEILERMRKNHSYIKSIAKF